jgi:biotin carboxylase
MPELPRHRRDDPERSAIMTNILVIAPTGREFRTLPRLASELGMTLTYDDFAGEYFDDFFDHDPDEVSLDIVEMIESTIAKHAGKVDGVTSAVGYPGMSAVALFAKRAGLPGPSPKTIIMCEHKYYSRLAQREFAPEATPAFHLINPQDASSLEPVRDFPVFLKPVKSCMSMNAFKIESQAELAQRVSEALLPRRFYRPFDDILKAHTDLELGCGYLLVEELLTGHQVSLEGYVHNGHCVVMGIIDAVMFPGTLSFKRFQYPSQLSSDVQQRMVDVATKFFKGIDYDNAMFNMELMYDPIKDQVRIIEVNPKIASQFPDLFERVDGTNSYSVLLQIAANRTPSFSKGKGQFKIAGSCVLRTFENQKVLKVPTTENLAAVARKYPDAIVQVIATEGKYLSEQLQDTASYRYGLVNIGANSEKELVDKFEDIKSMLDYRFESQEHSTAPVR